jgi:hypothetical protein
MATPLHLQKSKYFELVDLGQGWDGGKGSDQKSAENISQDQRLPQQLGHTTAHDGSAEDISEIPERN